MTYYLEKADHRGTENTGTLTNNKITNTCLLWFTHKAASPDFQVDIRQLITADKAFHKTENLLRDGSNVVAIIAYYFCQGRLSDLLQLTGRECCFGRMQGSFWLIFEPEPISHSQASKLLSENVVAS